METTTNIEASSNKESSPLIHNENDDMDFETNELNDTETETIEMANPKDDVHSEPHKVHTQRTQILGEEKLQELSNITIKTVSDLRFENDRSKHFFFNNHNSKNDYNGGIEFIVKTSIIKKKYSPTQFLRMNVPFSQQTLQMKLARMAFLLGKNECINFLEIIKGVYQLGCEDGFSHLKKKLQSDSEVEDKVLKYSFNCS